MQYQQIPEYRNPRPLDRDNLPVPVLDGRPSWIDFYWLAWEQAWNHVVENEHAPQSPYMDEGCTLERVWIWDTCFMALFARYGRRDFPGVESLRNFYAPLHDGVRSPLGIHHRDNPPLFAWCEEAHFRLHGDRERIRRLLKETRYLQKHYDYFEALTPATEVGEGRSPVALERTELGFRWSGNPSGMDNTPRGRDDYGSILWVDALAQQAFSAASIARLAREIGDEATARAFDARFASNSALLNDSYWDDETGCYYDIAAAPPHRHVKVMTPASFWPLLAGVASPEQARRMRDHAVDPARFGGPIPWPSIARDDPDYEREGRYWRGGIWLPTAYMAIKGLENYGFFEEADSLAENLLAHMHQTWRDFSPHTIWETYHPERPAPSEGKKAGRLVRPDFCGWSALGPISLLIENVLGFHSIDAASRRIDWRIHRNVRHRIRNLAFGDIRTDILWDNGEIHVESNAGYELVANGTRFHVRAGSQKFDAPVTRPVQGTEQE